MSSPQMNIPWILIAGTVVMLIMVFAIIFFVIIHQRKVIQLQLELQKEKERKQNQLLEATLESQEMERKRIAAELPDDVGTLLSTVKLRLNSIQPEDLRNPAKANTLEECKNFLDVSIQTIRNISSGLQPASIRDFGLQSTMQYFCEKIRQSSGIDAVMSVQDGNIERMPHELELAVYRIIQELTSNILKHAAAKNIHFTLLKPNQKLFQVIIEHDGNGLSQEEFENKLYNTKGLGLKNIQNRLNVIGGTIYFSKSNNISNAISVHIPLTV